MFVHARHQVFLVIFGYESGCLGLENKYFAKELLQKTIFAGIGLLRILWSFFSMILVALGPIFITFGALEIGLKFIDSSG